MTNKAQVPPIAFLGAAESVLRLPNVGPNFVAYNVRQLRSDIVAPFYPLPVKGLQLLFGLYGPAKLDRWTLRFVNEETGLALTMSAGLQVFKASERPPIPGAVNVAPKPDNNPWWLLGLAFPDELALIEKPTRFAIYSIQDGAELWTGGLRFWAYDPEPLTPERVAALRTDPDATRSARIDLSCKVCSTRLGVYTALDRNSSPSDDLTWYQDLPDEFRCRCGKTVIDLKYLRRGFHAVLGERFTPDSENISVTRLYEVSNLEVVLDAFRHLLSVSGEEPRLQEFMVANPILLHMFSPRKLIPKAPILSRYYTDFAVITASGELVLIELEAATKRLLKKDGHQSADLTHAVGQVNDWLHEFRTHRLACLSNIGLKEEEVSRVRGLVIIGREGSAEPDHLRRFKAGMSGEVTVLTYDDLVAGLVTLIKEMRREYRPEQATGE